MTDRAPIEFFFEFSSPYGYIASELVEGLERRTGRAITWKPFLLGPVFKATGMAPLVEIPMKGEYSKRDFSRTARYHDVPFRMPSKFPIGTVAALRAFYWAWDRDPARARDLAHRLYRAFFTEDRDISEPATVVEIARAAGLDGDALQAALADPALKERARNEVDTAIARGVFGSPFFIVEGEPFWGNDRIPMLEEWLRRGGW